MKLPFGIDMMSFIVGMLFAMFVLPYILGLFARRGASKQAA